MDTPYLFWESLDTLLGSSNLVIDRPKGSTHPRFPDFVYPFDYGFLEGTQSGDGDGIDVWVGGLPDRSVTGVLCTLDLEKRDSEIKVLVGCTAEEMQEILSVHNKGLQSAILMRR